MTKLPSLERGLQILELAASSQEGFTWKQACSCLGSVSTATVARVLKVLAEREYIIQLNGKYKSGPAANRIIPTVSVNSLLITHGPLLAKEFSEDIHESCVVAVFDKDKFRFTGVQIIEGSMGYSPPEMIINQEWGHVMTQILHTMEPYNNVKSRLESGKISFGYRGTVPEWKEYRSVLSEGRKTGIFLEYGWRRPQAYRMAVPVFTEELSLAGAFMCGYSNKKLLQSKVKENLACYLKVMSKIPGYEKIFNAAIQRMDARGVSL